MFLKQIEKGTRDGKKYIYYRLCESIRIGGKTRHNNLLNLGTLSGLEEEDRPDSARLKGWIWVLIPFLEAYLRKQEHLQSCKRSLWRLECGLRMMSLFG